MRVVTREVNHGSNDAGLIPAAVGVATAVQPWNCGKLHFSSISSQKRLRVLQFALIVLIMLHYT